MLLRLGIDATSSRESAQLVENSALWLNTSALRVVRGATGIIQIRNAMLSVKWLASLGYGKRMVNITNLTYAGALG